MSSFLFLSYSCSNNFSIESKILNNILSINECSNSIRSMNFDFFFNNFKSYRLKIDLIFQSLIEIVIALLFFKKFLREIKSDNSKFFVNKIWRFVKIRFTNFSYEIAKRKFKIDNEKFKIVDERFVIATDLILRDWIAFNFNSSIVSIFIYFLI